MTTTITVSDEVKRELLRVAARLQAQTGKKVDYDDVLTYLVRGVTKRMDLFRRATTPSLDVSSEKVQAALRRGRKEDRRRELVLEKRYSSS